MTVREFIVLLLLTAAVTAAGMLAFSGVGRSQGAPQPCAPLAAFEREMAEKYGETLFSVGTIGEGRAFRLYVNPGTRTWTAVGVMPGGGVACAIAAGNGFDMVKPSAPAQAL